MCCPPFLSRDRGLPPLPPLPLSSPCRAHSSAVTDSSRHQRSERDDFPSLVKAAQNGSVSRSRSTLERFTSPLSVSRHAFGKIERFFDEHVKQASAVRDAPPAERGGATAVRRK